MKSKFLLLGLLCLTLLSAGHHACAQLAVPTRDQQTGPWAGNALGFGPPADTIHLYGCGVTCLSMVHQFYGVSTDPGDMNQWLKNNNAFGPWPGVDPHLEYLIWGPKTAGRGVSYNGRVSNPSGNPVNLQNVISGEINAGHPLIAETRSLLRNGTLTQHYVVITGYSGSNYSINDPVGGVRIPFSSRYSVIYNLYEYRGPAAPPPAPVNSLVPLFRYRSNYGRGDRFYTTNFAELGNAGQGGWVYEGVQCNVYSSQLPGTIPLYRYDSPSLGLHFFTVQNADLRWIGYNQEGIACYVYPADRCYADPNIVPLYRYYNNRSQAHFYTTNYGELGGGGGDWSSEGVECYVRR